MWDRLGADVSLRKALKGGLSILQTIEKSIPRAICCQAKEISQAANRVCYGEWLR